MCLRTIRTADHFRRWREAAGFWAVPSDGFRPMAMAGLFLVGFAVVRQSFALGSTVDLQSFDPDTVSSLVLPLLDLIIGYKFI